MVSEDFYQSMLDNLFDGVYYVDQNRVITYWNKAAEMITGYSKADVIGTACADNILRHIDSYGNELCELGCPLHETIQDGSLRESFLFLHHKAGHRVPVHIRIAPIRDEAGEIIGGVEIFSDNSSTLNMLQQLEDIQQENIADPLLKIGNRRFGDMIFETRLLELQAYQVSFCVIMLDIDDFKSINDRLGHNVGDQILEMITRSLESTLRGRDSIIRWGGDEFVLILPNAAQKGLEEILDRIRIFVEKSFLEVNGELISVTVSFGATLAKPGDNMESLIDRADKLMYQSKLAGGNRYTIG
jgi:diguanylate cyclase (GGDEF)-like protein/PAS domain S-box-containing protein